MNRPTYAAIRAHSSDKPVLVFVASRRQTRITALELINLAAADNPRQFVLDEEEVARRVSAEVDCSCCCLRHPLIDTNVISCRSSCATTQL